jgi:phosphoribosylformimino-5-aminoimidazole carboxamide ribotide isomerase
MILYPAIDLRRGCCVRLEKGEAERETVYPTDPREVAAGYAAGGARWIHVVDLDAAFGDGSNRRLVCELAAATPLRVQVGGGLRSAADIADVLDGGAARAVIGTAAVENPALVREAVREWGAARIAVGIDARGRRPAVRGWQQESGADLFDLAAALADAGVRTLVYTDIERDGMFSGPNLETSVELAERSGLEVIVSGGVGSLDDVRNVADAASRAAGIDGVIVGKALYEGRLRLEDALALAGT